MTFLNQRWQPLPRVIASLRVLAVAASLAGLGCDRTPEKKPEPPPPPEVEVVHPTSRDVTSYLEYTGNTTAFKTVRLEARVQGFLEKQLFVDGALVKQGDLLYVIEKQQYQAAVDKASAELEAAKASLAGAEADAILAADLAAQQAGPEIDRVIKAARRDVAKATVEDSAAALVRAKIDLGYCEIRAPLDGRISRSNVDVGNLVGRSETTLLATLYQVSPIYVAVAASEADLLAARRRSKAAGRELSPVNQAAASPVPVFVSLADEDDFRTRGRIDYIDPTLDRATGTVGIRLVFDNEDNFLVPGLFVRVRFELQTSEQIVVPQVAIQQDQAGFFVLVVDEKSVVSRRRVKAGQNDGTDRVISEGLTTTDRVIVSGHLKARPGMTVAPKLAKPPAPEAPAAKPATEKPASHAK